MNAGFGGFRWFTPGGVGMQIDDLTFCDSTGSAPYDGFLGNVRVQALLPAGAGASTQFTPSTGSDPNWQCAANLAISDAALCFRCDGRAGGSLHRHRRDRRGDGAGRPGRGAYRQDDATQRSAQNLLKSGTSFATTAAVACNQSYAFQTDGPFTADPANRRRLARRGREQRPNRARRSRHEPPLTAARRRGAGRGHTACAVAAPVGRDARHRPSPHPRAAAGGGSARRRRAARPRIAGRASKSCPSFRRSPRWSRPLFFRRCPASAGR